MALDVFISYSHKDRALRDELATHLSTLQRQGQISAWYDGDITPGVDWKTAIQTHLNKARLILLLISADFMASDFCYSIEMQQALARHKSNQARVIPIILRPTDWEKAPFAALQALPTQGKPVSKWRDHDEAFQDVVKGLRAAIKDLAPVSTPVADPSNSGPLSLSAEQVQVWTVPFQRNPFFTGRAGALAYLQDFLQAQQRAFISQPAAISGLGGIGKTQTAIEYAYRYAHEYQFVFWVQADTRETLIADYVTLARLLAFPECDDPDQNVIVEAVRRWLSQHPGWLLILDNADTLVLLDDFVPPRPRGHILITTRTQLTGTRAARVEMKEMSEEEGARLLLTRTGMLAPDAPLSTAPAPVLALATTLVHELDGLPLALDQAGAYIEETGCGLSHYLDLYRTHRHTLLSRRSKQPSSHPEPVDTTWSLSFARLEQTNPAAAELLRGCAFLHPDAIPEEVFTTESSCFSPLLQQTARDPMQFDEAISDLLSYSLLRRLPDTGDLSIHRLVQAVLTHAMDEATQQRWEQCIVQAIDNLFPFADVTTWSTCQRYLPHAMLCAEAIERRQVFWWQAARLLHNLASYLNDRAQYPEAELLYQRALAIREQVLGPEHPSTAGTLNNLALLYFNQGKDEQAELLYQRALAIREQVLGPEHPDTAGTLDNLATLYSRQGKDEQAEPLYQRALAIKERVLGPEHPYTVGTLNNLALLYSRQGKYEQAELLYQRALAIREQVLGPEHPRTASTILDNLATLYLYQGKDEQAEPLYQRALAIKERVLGPEHPSTASTLDNLAGLYLYQGKDEQAELLYQRALAIKERVLGPEHPYTVGTLDNLATLYLYQGKDEQAELLYQRALAIREQVLGPAHPHTARTLNNLTELRRVRKKDERAEEHLSDTTP